MAEVMEQVMVHNADAAARVIDGEAFIITPHDNQIHNLTGVAARVWELGGEGLTVQRIVERIVEEYDVKPEVAKRDVISFVRDLAQRKIVTLK
ncbi:MAG: PqqD family protein [Candidatus Eisenbacteria sp.]|nr:PqqD family protein [Candidatus Eisenbacteria bacterium]